MENIVIDKTTYQVHRIFVGTQNISELIQRRICEDHAQALPLTGTAAIRYNNPGDCSIVRRNNGN